MQFRHDLEGKCNKEKEHRGSQFEFCFVFMDTL